MNLIKDIIRNKRRSDFRREKRVTPDKPQRKRGRPRTSQSKQQVKPDVVIKDDTKRKDSSLLADKRIYNLLKIVPAAHKDFDERET